jgi:hypothetical protein
VEKTKTRGSAGSALAGRIVRMMMSTYTFAGPANKKLRPVRDLCADRASVSYGSRSSIPADGKRGRIGHLEKKIRFRAR